MSDNNSYCNDMAKYGCVPVFPEVKENFTESLRNISPAPEYVVSSDGWLMKGAKNWQPENWQPVAKINSRGAYGWYFDNSTQVAIAFPFCPGKLEDVQMLQVQSAKSGGHSVNVKITLSVALLFIGWINLII